MSEIAVKLENVSKYYKLYNSPKDRLKESLSPFRKKYHREFYALRDIDMEVYKGEIFGIIGKNGSGKSTLLKIISRVLTQNSGTVQVNGTISALLELGAGFNPEFTGMENVYFYGTLLGFSQEEMQERIDGILGFADIGDFINQPLKTYSSGMKARLGFAVATEVNPDVLIVDEVLAVGDAIFQRKCYARMESLLRDGKTVLLVSHSRNNIVSLCSRAMFLNDGCSVSMGETLKVVNDYESFINRQIIEKGQNALSGNDQKKEKVLENLKVSKDSYDMSIVTEPQVINGEDAEFVSFGIYNDKREKVNILKPGDRYIVRSVFNVKKDINGVQFAMRILNKSGLRLSWMGYPLKKREFMDIKAGDNLKIEFAFDCNLLDEICFIEAGLQSYMEDTIYTHVSGMNLYACKINRQGENTDGIVSMNYREQTED